jgi:biofilm PGA synthesis N-glycosyltransferase PgaC
MAQNRLRFAVAIPVSNEAQNIGALLERVVDARPERVLVVSDGSTDDTDALVQAFAAHSDIPVHLQTNPVRRGKADAVNRIIAALPDVEIIAMVSGDAMPQEGCIERLVAAFHDSTVGVAAGRPVPEGPGDLPAVAITRLLWALHHRIALEHPKSTEITVFRNVLARIDPHSRADEAAIEAGVMARGLRVVYVPEALIRTNSPLSLRDYAKQRTSVTIGHLMVARQGYGVGTLSWRQRFRALRDVWRQDKVRLSTVVYAVGLEACIYVAAWSRLRFGPALDGMWSRSNSTKRTFERRRER